MTCDMPKPCEFPSLDSCQKRFLWDYKEAELASYQLVGLAFQVRYAKEFPQALGFESLDPFLRVSRESPCSKAMEEDGGDKRLVELELACEVDGVAPPDPV